MDKPMTQYEKFLSKDNFILAYYRLLYMPDNLHYAHFYKDDLNSFGMFLNRNIEQLIKEISTLTYHPHSIERYYIPKKNNLARPVSLLYFTDLLIYQAICNVIMEATQKNYFAAFNNTTFANIPNSELSTNKHFQFLPWSAQWKKFRSKIRSYYDTGYKWIAEFDIASFYDTINHSILKSILESNNIEEQLIAILINYLAEWSKAGAKLVKNVGIPQGPECSAWLAELYMLELDNKFNNVSLDVQYLRYADDIRIMAKCEQECQKAITLLDLHCKDYGLIAQSNKVVIYELDDCKIHNYLDKLGLQLSSITYEYRKNKKLSDKRHNQLKRKLRNVFSKESDLYLDKTILNFAFYKLNKDDEIKELILTNWTLLYQEFDGVVYYLDKFYNNDPVVLTKIKEVLLNDDILFQFNKALLFEKFINLPFDEAIYKHLQKINGERFWIVKYFAADWLMRTNHASLVSNIIAESDNYHLKTKRLLSILSSITNEYDKGRVAVQYYNSDIMLSLYAFYLMPVIDNDLNEDSATNYILNIYNADTADYLMDHFKNNYGIKNSESKAFVHFIKSDSKLYLEAINNVENFVNNINYLPSMALMSLDLFHNIIVNLLLPQNESDFGNKIEQLKNEFPYTSVAFDDIHNARCQKTLAHYMDKKRNIRKLITKTQLENLLISSNLQKAYKELCKYFSRAKGLN